MSSLRVVSFLLAVLFTASAYGDPPGRAVPSRSPTRPPALRGETPRVVVFMPHGPRDTFWTLFRGFMDAAADDLGITLEVEYAEDSRPRMREQIAAACAGPDRADAVVFQSFKDAGESFLVLAEAAHVPAFVVNAGVQGAAGEAGPRSEMFNWWIGEMLPDDRGAGKRLANALIDRARSDPSRIGDDGLVHMIALEGVVSDGASIERTAGLREAIAGRDDVVLHQVVAANWTRDAAAFRTGVLLDRYPRTSVVWAANDPMALGAVDAVRARKQVPGRDVLVGGVDWTVEGLAAIEDGSLDFSVGGHFMEGAWVMVLLYDWLNDADFAESGLRRRSRMSLIHRDNLAEYRAILDPEAWPDMNFRSLSRALHPERPEPAFGPETAMTIQRGDAAP